MRNEEPWSMADTVAMAGPRYCPHCDRTVNSRETLCPECGGTLRVQGFCTVCERYWKLATGEECPKHEVRLAECAPVIEREESLDWTTVATYADVLQASAPQLRLEAEGIPTFLDGEHMGVNTIYQVATGGVKLQVPREKHSDSRVILSQVWTPPEIVDDLDDAWDDLAPAPWDARRRVMKGVILFLLFWPCFFALAALIPHILGFHN